MEIQEINRAEFLRKLSLSGATLMAIYCMGTELSSCSKKSDPSPATPNTPNTPGTSTKIDFVLDLTSNDFKDLVDSGSFLIKDNIIIANSTSGKYVALSKVCTHEGTTIGYRKDNDDFRCPNHGSLFNIDGTVKGAPATASLKVYKTEVQDTGKKLRIFE
jgi:cytochrome b6-f complex iron-sulfur subunit